MCIDFDYNFMEFHSKGSNQQYPSIVWDDGLAPIRRQALISTNDGYITNAYMCRLPQWVNRGILLGMGRKIWD